MEKSTLIMLDDTVNFFTEKLNELGVLYENASDNIADRNFTGIFFDRDGNLTPTGTKAFCETKPKPEGIEFINTLKEHGVKIILCTSRDIRLCFKETENWLKRNTVNYDYLFTATAPAGLCIDMNIPSMIYNLPENGRDNINIVGFRENGETKEPYLIKKFENFGEAKEWTIKKSL